MGAGERLTLTPSEFFLSQNYPNPFNPTTTISYGLPYDAQVRLDIFNIMGQKVRTLIDFRQVAGFRNVTWDGRDGAGKSVASGVYFYRINAGDHLSIKKMLLMK
jgi:flagellar hook assembly protein FlgD